MSSKNYTDLGRRIAEALSRKGLNQTKFANLARITQGGVSRFLTGKDRIPEDKLIAWAKMLGDDFGIPYTSGTGLRLTASERVRFFCVDKIL